MASFSVCSKVLFRHLHSHCFVHRYTRCSAACKKHALCIAIPAHFAYFAGYRNTRRQVVRKQTGHPLYILSVRMTRSILLYYIFFIFFLCHPIPPMKIPSKRTKKHTGQNTYLQTKKIFSPTGFLQPLFTCSTTYFFPNTQKNMIAASPAPNGQI